MEAPPPTSKPVTINIGSLKMTRNDVQSRLIRRLTPEIYKAFAAMYDDARESGEEIEDFFIGLMEEIPTWDKDCPDILEVETTEIIDRIPQLNTYLRVILISHVMGISVLRYGEKPSDVDVEVPPLEEFIHAVYISCADFFAADPSLVDRNGGKKLVTGRRLSALKIIKISIADVIQDMLPTDQVIQDYLQDLVASKSVTKQGEEIQEEGEEEVLVEDPPVKGLSTPPPEPRKEPMKVTTEDLPGPLKTKTITIEKDRWEAGAEGQPQPSRVAAPVVDEEELLLAGINDQDLEG